MEVILSIKPKFVEKIFEGTKKFEFRRSIFKNKQVQKVVVYASAPISKIVGEFEIDEIIHNEIESLWSKTQEYSGISKDYYINYFLGKKNGYAIKIKSSKKYNEYYSIQEKFGMNAPQSFAYIK